jgi:hypothetical protein
VSTGGNRLLSGLLTSGTDDFFRVKKVFLSILAAVTNMSTIRDPTGWINQGTRCGQRHIGRRESGLLAAVNIQRSDAVPADHQRHRQGRLDPARGGGL